MIRYTRPSKPDSFRPTDEDKQNIQDRIDPSNHRIRTGQTLNSNEFKRVWRNHKDPFILAQYSKCAYCEREYTGDGSVEHVHPKAKVAVLENPGVELETLRVSGRTVANEGVKPGYWWKAYEWDNYCLICKHCNSKWKISFLVVDPPHSSPDPPHESRNETIQFIHPYDVDPEEHLTVEKGGNLVGTDDLGRGTIKTLGFDERKSLIQTRKNAYEASYRLAQSWLQDTVSQDRLAYELSPKRQQALARRCAIKDFLQSVDLQDDYADLLALAYKNAGLTPP